MMHSTHLWFLWHQIPREETWFHHYLGYSFRLAARVLLYAPSHRQDSTYHILSYTSHGTLAGTRNSSDSLPWGIDLMTHHTTSRRSSMELHLVPQMTRLMFYTHASVAHVTSVPGPDITSVALHLVTPVSRLVHCLLHGKSICSWVVGSILHGVDPLSYFSFQPVLHDWCNKGRGMFYPVCGMVHIKEPLLL